MAGFLTVLKDISDERTKQDEKWGQQNHTDGTGPAKLWMGYRMESLCRWMRARCQRHASQGRTTWESILSEEIFEAYAESDPVKLREELVQSAAVIVAWIQAIDRRVDQ